MNFALRCLGTRLLGSTVLNYFRKGASVGSSVLSSKELALKLTRLFVNPFEWTKVPDSQLIVNSL